MRAGEDLPRVLLRRLERERHALAIQVDLEDLDGDFLSDLDDLGRVLDVLPRQLGHVNETVHATQVDERTEVDDRRHGALADLALVEVVQERRARLGLRLLEQGAARQDHVVAVLVELEDLRLDLLAEVRREVADAAQLDQRCGQEAAQADVDDESTLDDLDHGAGDDTVGLLDLLHVAPRALVLRALLRQDEAAFLVLLLENERLDGVADLDDLIGVDVVLDGELARGDDTLGLVADVEEHLVAVDLHDGSFDEVAVVEELQGQFDRGQKVLSRSDVIDGDLLGGRGGRCDSHVVGCPCWVGVSGLGTGIGMPCASAVGFDCGRAVVVRCHARTSIEPARVTAQSIRTLRRSRIISAPVPASGTRWGSPRRTGGTAREKYSGSSHPTSRAMPEIAAVGEIQKLQGHQHPLPLDVPLWS